MSSYVFIPVSLKGYVFIPTFEKSQICPDLFCECPEVSQKYRDKESQEKKMTLKIRMSNTCRESVSVRHRYVTSDEASVLHILEYQEYSLSLFIIK